MAAIDRKRTLISAIIAVPERPLSGKADVEPGRPENRGCERPLYIWKRPLS